jgi:hypothetical protein
LGGRDVLVSLYAGGIERGLSFEEVASAELLGLSMVSLPVLLHAVVLKVMLLQVGSHVG